MDTHIASKKTVVSAAALLLIGASIAFTQRVEPSVTRATVCVKSNGQLRMLPSGATSCGPSEQPVQWVVDGEVTDVRVGEGLVASREGGVVNLALDPSILECEQCNDGKVFAGFNDGPGQIPMGVPPAHEPQRIATLDVPEGDYAIFAKLLLGHLANTGGSRVRCKLTAGADSDEAEVVLENSKQTSEGLWGGASRDVMNLQVVHHFDTPGLIVMSCADGFTLPQGDHHFDGDTLFAQLKIIAMKVSNISNVGVGGQ